MKKLFISIIIWSACVFSGYCNQVNEYTISFSEKNFSYTENTNGSLSIDTYQPNDYFLPEAGFPAVPLTSYDIQFPGGYSYLTSKVVGMTTHLVRSNVVVSPSPYPIPSGSKFNSQSPEIVSYSISQFPMSNWEYVTTSNTEDSSIFHFLSSPFIYYPDTKELYFIDNISIEVSGIPTGQRINAAIKSPLYMASEGDKAKGNAPMLQSETNYEAPKIDYVIITNENLKPSFQKLLDWKKEKGLFSAILTIEEINNIYYGNDIQYKIKNCLYDLTVNYGLDYALLGGDEEVIPVRYCYSEVKGSKDIIYRESIPSDLYYSCFEGDFKWDYNGNGIYGELEDNINFQSSINVTRLPVRTNEDVNKIVDKIIQYEKKPKINKRILLGGVKVSYTDTITHLSDAATYGQIMKDTYIRPYWNGEVVNFFDDYTDFEEGENYNITPQNLSEQINKGYAFIEMDTHGSQTLWSLENSYYTTSNASVQINPFHTLIVTDACYTNAFDRIPPQLGAECCLSEAFLRNENSGVIGYLGSSRYGWSPSKQNNYLSHSQRINATFFKNVFDKSNSNKSFGSLVRQTKQDFISLSQYYGSYRWLLHSLNPLGDPETPIYPEIPRIFSLLTVEIKDQLIINTGVYDTKVCVMSVDDGGETFYKVVKKTRDITFSEYPMNGNICVTKQGYQPKLFSFRLFQNQVISEESSFTANLIKLGKSLNTSLAAGPVNIKGKVTFNGTETIIDRGVNIEKGATVSIINTK